MHRILPLAVLLASGCTAAKAGYALTEAQRAVHEAQEAHADERAVYELTLAEQYLLKAREEVGYSDYGAADQLARKAVAMADKAKANAEEGGVAPEDIQALPENRRDVPVEEREQTPFSPDEEDP